MHISISNKVFLAIGLIEYSFYCSPLQIQKIYADEFLITSSPSTSLKSGEKELNISKFGISFSIPKEWSYTSGYLDKNPFILLSSANSEVVIKVVFNIDTTEKLLTEDTIAKFIAEKFSVKNSEDVKVDKILISNLPVFEINFRVLNNNGKVALKGAELLFKRGKLSTLFSYVSHSKSFDEHLIDYNSIINSINLEQFKKEEPLKIFSDPQLGVSFTYPGVWPTPTINNTIPQSETAIWSLSISPQCKKCRYPYRYPLYLQKFDGKVQSIESMIKADRVAIFEDNIVDGVRNIVGVQVFDKSYYPNHFNYFVKDESIYRVVYFKRDDFYGVGAETVHQQ